MKFFHFILGAFENLMQSYGEPQNFMELDLKNRQNVAKYNLLVYF